MLFTWDWKNTCVVYKWWHVKTFQGFIGTLIAIALLTVGYELLKSWIAKWKARTTGVLPAATGRARSSLRTKHSILYALQVGYSFLLMLVFMTYNGWYMLAVVVGAGVGHYLFGDTDGRGLECH